MNTRKDLPPAISKVSKRFSRMLIGSLILMLALSAIFTTGVFAQTTTVDLQVTSKTVNVPAPGEGATIIYTVVVRNNSTTTAVNI